MIRSQIQTFVQSDEHHAMEQFEHVLKKRQIAANHEKKRRSYPSQDLAGTICFKMMQDSICLVLMLLLLLLHVRACIKFLFILHIYLFILIECNLVFAIDL